MRITIYYINNNWKIVFKLIEIKDLQEKYSIDYLLSVLNLILIDFEIEDKLLI